jgi:hypothetical protein
MLLLDLLFVKRPRRTRAGGESNGVSPQDFLMGLAATALTILPLRAVLVPTEVAGLTFIDLILGTELLLLLAIGVWWYLWVAWGSNLGPAPLLAGPTHEGPAKAAPTPAQTSAADADARPTNPHDT